MTDHHDSLADRLRKAAAAAAKRPDSALARLAPARRTLFELKQAGHSMEQLSELLGREGINISLQTLASYLCRLRQAERLCGPDPNDEEILHTARDLLSGRLAPDGGPGPKARAATAPRVAAPAGRPARPRKTSARSHPQTPAGGRTVVPTAKLRDPL